LDVARETMTVVIGAPAASRPPIRIGTVSFPPLPGRMFHVKQSLRVELSIDVSRDEVSSHCPVLAGATSWSTAIGRLQAWRPARHRVGVRR